MSKILTKSLKTFRTIMRTMKSMNVTTETRDLRIQPTGGASGTSGLRVGNNPKATGAHGSSLKSQGEAVNMTTGKNKVLYLIVTVIFSMKLRIFLFFKENINEPIYLLNKVCNQYPSFNTLDLILMYYKQENTYLTSTLSIFKTIKIEIALCSIKPDITLLIKYVPNITVNKHLYDYPISIKRLLKTNVPNRKQCFLLYPTEPIECCGSLCVKSIIESLTTVVPSVYHTPRIIIIIILYIRIIILVIKHNYVNQYIGLLENIFFIKKCNKPKLNCILFQGAKRKGNEAVEEPKARRRRAAMLELGMSYAELSKTHTMLEARASDPEKLLDQTDFENLDGSLIFLHLDLKPTPDFGIVKMGLSQGGVWVACKDKETVDFVEKQVPNITPPENEKKYTYKIYGPNNRPFKYYRIRVPERFWSTPERFVDLVKHFNKDLDYSYLAGDFYKNAHLRVSGGLADKAKEIDQGHFFVTLEVEENMVERLAKKNGIVMIGPNALEIKGGGIEKAIEKFENERNEQTEMETEGGDDTLNYSA